MPSLRSAVTVALCIIAIPILAETSGAQTGRDQTGPDQTGYPPPENRYLPGTYPPPDSAPTPTTQRPYSAPAAPPPSYSAPVARPGNEIGTGSSLPLGDRASNIEGSDTRSQIAPNLPPPLVGPDASPRAFLLAARDALAAGRTGAAQEALERAQTRLLDRSVPLFQTDTPDRSPLVDQISAALHALGARDWQRAMQIIDATIARMADMDRR
jgi:hypothetical protein